MPVFWLPRTETVPHVSTLLNTKYAITPHPLSYWIMFRRQKNMVFWSPSKTESHNSYKFWAVPIVCDVETHKVKHSLWRVASCMIKESGYTAPGGALNFFSGRGVRPGFPKCGTCELTFASEKGVLWAENFQILGLVSWKFPNLGACELKISKFGGMWAKIWVKIEAVEAKISKFSQKGVLWTDSFAWNGTLASGRRGVKRGSSGPHIPIPPSRSVPPPPPPGHSTQLIEVT